MMEKKVITYKKAAIRILMEEMRKMHIDEIIGSAIEHGLLSPRAKYPDRTMSSTITEDIVNLGEDSPFYRAKRGVYGLRPEFVQATKNHIGMAGELSVAYELLCRGCTIYRPIVDAAGIDIISLKNGKTAYIQVKLANKRERGYVTRIKKEVYDRAEKYGTCYVFVLQDDKETIFAIFSADQIRKIIAERNAESYSLTLTRKGDKLFLSRRDQGVNKIEVYSDHWDLILNDENVTRSK